jgi:carboxypeptidase Q
LFNIHASNLHKHFFIAETLVICILCAVSIAFGEGIKDKYQGTADRIITATLEQDASYNRLAYLCDAFGHRMSGSESLELSIDWILDEMKSDGLENVHGEEVMVPRWIRGNESAELIHPYNKKLPMLGLGRSVGTPHEGIESEVLVVGSYDELENRRDEVEGKIVLFDVPFTTYGETVQYRYGGASAAAKHGAVASVIRSITPFSMNTPHTGGMSYDEDIIKIPHAALTLEDASLIHRIQDLGEVPVIRLFMEAHFEKDSPSRNIIAELKGTEFPDEIVVLGGHIDSWDVGQGAHDDAGGCVAAWEAVRILKKLGLRPRRTLRVVMWTNEEYGLRGGKNYRDTHKEELENHILAIESDNGVFNPRGFGFTGSKKARELVKQVTDLLKPINADTTFDNGEAADTGPLLEEGVPVMALKVDVSKYFWYHHTAADAMDKIDKEEFNRCVAALAVMSYVIADLEERLPR